MSTAQDTQQQQRIDQLRKSAESVHAYYDELNQLSTPHRDQLPMSFFRALATLTLERAEEGVDSHNVRFTARELADKVIELGFVKKKPKQPESDWVRSNWSKLEELIESGKDLLQQISHRNGQDFYPGIDKEESNGGQGNYSYYYLTPKHFNTQDDIAVSHSSCPAGGLIYVQESLINIPRWARWINGFTLQSWRRYAYILSGLITLASPVVFVFQ